MQSNERFDLKNEYWSTPNSLVVSEEPSVTSEYPDPHWIDMELCTARAVNRHSPTRSTFQRVTLMDPGVKSSNL